MKKFVSHIFFVTCLIICSISLSVAQNKDIDKEKNIITLINNKEYIINVSSALPLKGPYIHLTSNYYIKMYNDSVSVYLPYYGRAYSAPYGGGEGGIKTNGKYTNYKQSINKKKNKYTISFSANNKEDKYEFLIDIFLSGDVYIHVQSRNKQSISFSGELDNLEKGTD
ncbi:DUF4251 domain-containing protein [Coprobacter secundus]|uniref:DUF4251 domain-containing protein n=1 Tax=Coprobacter secundus subsp. similis TaxID=2751153 RepID=A0A7G1HW51_9BACT|nr:DUF4251 domain-containing protein [Coprobacter secundus]BCI63926.1 hypothetical protein Cop2CBH44_22790 [Coprobacter secundus subsp. similis]CCY38284.1 uncharacterized protein BN472_02513 [Tannerella sp. CAG:118]